jgi:hypothetical protein
MKQFVTGILFFAAAAAGAQTTFSIGPRWSNYSTRVEARTAPTARTGRLNAAGVVGGYRNGAFLLDFQYDHDPENGIGLSNVIVDTGDYQRDHGEVTVGLSRGVDLFAGLRFESLRVGGATVLGTNVAADLDIDHQAIVVGARLGKPIARPIGFYAMARGYVGVAKYRQLSARVTDIDTTGFHAEAGVPIAIGESAWSAVPGIEYEEIRGERADLHWKTNRFFINFIYSFHP